MTNELDIQKIIDMNYRLLLMLGYATGLTVNYQECATGKEKDKCKWLLKAVENVLYLDKPLPPIP